MLKVHEISKSYSGKNILNKISFFIDKGDKAAIIGSNGVGKTTLMKIIAGFEKPDEGIIEIDNSEMIGYLRQEFEIVEENQSIVSFIKKYIGIDKLEEKLNVLQDSMGNDPKIIEEFCEIQEKYILLDGYNFDYKLNVVLNGLGFENEMREVLIRNLSGGQKSKIFLAAVLLKGAELILLDEPTNNLDIKSIEWLEEYLSSIDVPCLIISHDRRFLNKVTNKTFEINFFDRTIDMFPGNYSEYSEFKKKQEEKLIERYNIQQEEIQQLRESAKQKKDWANKGRKQGVKDNDKYTRGYERDRASGLASNAKNIEKQIEKMSKIERPKIKNKLQIKINFSKIKGSTSIIAKDLICGYPNGFTTQPISLNCKFGDRIIIKGDNGSGKTTVLKTIVGDLKKIEGQLEIGTGIKIGYISQDTKEITDLTIEEYIKEHVNYEKLEDQSIIFRVLNQFNFSYEERKKQYSKLSPGERTRVKLVIYSLLDINTLILDEPTNHLDIEALEALEEVLESFKGTVIAISHDREFIKNSYPNTVYEMVNGNLVKTNIVN